MFCSVFPFLGLQIKLFYAISLVIPNIYKDLGIFFCFIFNSVTIFYPIHPPSPSLHFNSPLCYRYKIQIFMAGSLSYSSKSRIPAMLKHTQIHTQTHTSAHTHTHTHTHTLIYPPNVDE